jgi:hypothetical protein
MAMIPDKTIAETPVKLDEIPKADETPVVADPPTPADESMELSDEQAQALSGGFGLNFTKIE